MPSYVVKAAIADPRAKTFAFAKMRTMYGSKSIAKGDAVYAECRIADGSYKKDGETVYTTDIIANVFHKLDLGSRDDAAA